MNKSKELILPSGERITVTDVLIGGDYPTISITSINGFYRGGREGEVSQALTEIFAGMPAFTEERITSWSDILRGRTKFEAYKIIPAEEIVKASAKEINAREREDRERGSRRILLALAISMEIINYLSPQKTNNADLGKEFLEKNGISPRAIRVFIDHSSDGLKIKRPLLNLIR